jgi:acetate kinase
MLAVLSSVASRIACTVDRPVSFRRCEKSGGMTMASLQSPASIAATSAGCQLLYNESGMFGVSGISDDMRTLLASADPSAKQAVALFVYRIRRELGSMAAALGGIDALVFTAGIGEHAAEIRRRACVDAAWLGIDLDQGANAAGGVRITRPGSQTSGWVIPTDEDLMIALHTWNLLSAAARRSGDVVRCIVQSDGSLLDTKSIR